MNLDIETLEEIYGKSIISTIKENIPNLQKNVQYLEERQFRDIQEIVKLYPYAFLMDSVTFKEKVDKLIDSLGVDYIEKLDDNIFLWSEIDEY